MGIIDTLTAGFDLVRRRIWLIVLPVLLDIGLWLAPRLSVFELVRPVLRAALAPPPHFGANAEWLANTEPIVEMYRELFAALNLTMLIPASYPGMPSIGGAPSLPAFFGLQQGQIEVRSFLVLPVVLAGLLLTGLVVSTLYQALIAQALRTTAEGWGRFLRRLPRACLRVLGAALLLFVLTSLVTMPLALIASVLGLFSPALAFMLFWFLLFGIFWLRIYLAFVPQAILYGDDGVLRAVWHSAGIVRFSLWPTLGLLALVSVISFGFVFVWARLAVSAVGMLLAIVANAFLGTGLQAAQFIYYRDRLALLKERLAAAGLRS
ncbi:MAG: hypothetical protein ACUVX9_06750 [Anaerolineae bacterium]